MGCASLWSGEVMTEKSSGLHVKFILAAKMDILAAEICILAAKIHILSAEMDSMIWRIPFSLVFWRTLIRDFCVFDFNLVMGLFRRGFRRGRGINRWKAGTGDCDVLFWLHGSDCKEKKFFEKKVVFLLVDFKGCYALLIETLKNEWTNR